MNQSKLASSEVCQKCGRCCKEFWWVEYNFDFALRLMLLDLPEIVVEDRQIDGNNVFLVRVNRTCSKLRLHGEYSCTIYDKQRPGMCRQYPDNIPMTEWEIHGELCPLIKGGLEK
jgi:Fe-S-cluster containining protein